MPYGCRYSYIKFVFHIGYRLFGLLCGVHTSKKMLDVDYSFYLGDNYKETMSSEAVSTEIMNHVSWIDTQAYAV